MAVRRFTWEEMKKYWEIHSQKLSSLDFNKDPDGLENVCISSEPSWVNEYHSYLQKMVYQHLFDSLPQKFSDQPMALDVGCGAGRWCQFLLKNGYKVVGIDLQKELIEQNEKRFFDIKFFNTSIQNYSPSFRFDLISSVTVLQHIPFDEQVKSIKALRDLLKDNGYAIILENTIHQEWNVFSNSVENWQKKFQAYGFQLIKTCRYDYSFFLRLHGWGERMVFRLISRERNKAGEATPHPLIDLQQKAKTNYTWKRRINLSVKRLAVKIDAFLEPFFIRFRIPFSSRHCGFLFKTVSRN